MGSNPYTLKALPHFTKMEVYLTNPPLPPKTCLATSLQGNFIISRGGLEESPGSIFEETRYIITTRLAVRKLGAVFGRGGVPGKA